MNHLEISFTGKNAWWRYVVMILAIFAATNTIGAIPLLVSMGIKTASDPSILGKLAANSSDLSVLGLDPNIYLLEMIFPFLIGLAAFIFLVVPLNGRNLKQTINGTGRLRWNKIFISAFIWLFFSALYLFISIKVDPANYSVNNTSSTLAPLIIISILLIPFQAAWEEIIFRGYLMQGFAVWLKNRWTPVIFTSVLFAMMHIINPEIKEYGFINMMPQYLLFGIIFGVMTIMDDGADAAIGAHAANNAFLSVMLTTKGSVLQTPAVYEQHIYHPMNELLMMLVMGVLIITMMKVIFKWKGFGLLFKKVAPPDSIIQTP